MRLGRAGANAAEDDLRAISFVGTKAAWDLEKILVAREVANARRAT